jgi:enterochelin esterase-like enzyme
MKEKIKFLCLTGLTFICTCFFQLHAQYEGIHDKNLTYTGPETGDEIQYELYLPPDYSEDKGPYPLIIQLHGGGGNTQSDGWIPSYEIARNAGRIDDYIVVFPYGYAGTMWEDDIKEGKKPETNVILELLPYLEEKYPLYGHRDKRVISGFSMGAHGTMTWAAKYYDLFSVFVVMDVGDMTVDPNKNLRRKIEVVGENADLFRDKVALRFISTSGNPVTFLSELDSMNIAYSYEKGSCPTHSVACVCSDDHGQNTWVFIQEHIGSDPPGVHNRLP